MKDGHKAIFYEMETATAVVKKFDVAKFWKVFEWATWIVCNHSSPQIKLRLVIKRRRQNNTII